MTVSTKKSIQYIPYSDIYIESSFISWYKLGRPVLTVFATKMTPDENGRIPPQETFTQWRRDYNWEQRADILDAEVSHQIELRAVNERIEMLNRQAVSATELQESGMAYLNEHGFEKAADALRAVIQGAELERASRGLPTALVEISKMENSKLQDVVQKLMKRVTPEEAEQLSDGKVIEGESEEVNAEQ